ncbi:MAG TPA: Re/Si-specific NAD(P)(+) transhydrogenase subunit alpha [Acidimicrobiales bacterium]|nr:Re/Si-specific NAD(P)(+) transhydrogenase subunit alpha [Acidimicrobiales bacterium]
MVDRAEPSAAPGEPAENPTATVAVVAVAREAGEAESRVALVPDDVGRLRSAGFAVVVEKDAGKKAWFFDDAYVQAGADVLDRDKCFADSDVVLFVNRPSDADAGRLRPGQVVVGLLAPLVDPAFVTRLAELGVTAVSLDMLPRTLSRAQAMDVLSSQANIAGYKAALVAANAFGRYFPLLMTAAGTARPAEVLVLGAGVAGLQAIATAHRLGAIVKGYDVRPEAKEQVESLGGRFIELKSVPDAAGEGGYARVLTAEETAAQQEELNGHVAQHDVVITTAQVPGRRPPLLITAAAVGAMRAGSVVVDMAASPLGGNVEGSRPDATTVSDNGVTIIGAGNLASTMPMGASTAYSHNVCALLAHLAENGKVAIDLTDEIQAGVVITFDGKVVNPATAELAGSNGREPLVNGA